MKRTHVILSGLLLLQVVLILVLRSPSGGASATEPRALFPELTDLEAAVVRIEGEDQVLTLERSVGEWGIREAGGYPVDDSKVEDLIDSLKDIEVGRPVVTGSRYHESLQVAEDDHVRRIEIGADPDGEPEIELYMGSAPNYRRSHVRRADQSEVFEAAGLGPYDVRPQASAWVEREVIGVDPERVVAIELANASGSFALERSEDGWKIVSPAGRDATGLDGDAVDDLVRSVTSVSLADPVGPVDDAAHGFAGPAAVAKLRIEGENGADGRTVELVVGAVPEDNESRRYVTRRGSGYTVTVWGSSVEDLVDGGLDDLLETAGDDESG